MTDAIFVGVTVSLQQTTDVMTWPQLRPCTQLAKFLESWRKLHLLLQPMVRQAVVITCYYYPCAVCARVMCLCPSICVCVCVWTKNTLTRAQYAPGLCVCVRLYVCVCVCGQKTHLFTSHRSKFATKVHFAASSLNL